MLLGYKRMAIRIRLYDAFDGYCIHLKYDFHCLDETSQRVLMHLHCPDLLNLFEAITFHALLSPHFQHMDFDYQ